MTRPPPPDLAPDLVERYVYEATAEKPEAGTGLLAWTTIRPGGGQAAIWCRAGSGRGKPACGRPAVAWLDRRRAGRRNWWAYCERHLYGRWMEDGQIMYWRLVEVDQASRSASD